MRLPKLALTKVSKSLLPLGLFIFSSLPALAHELWLEPESFQIQSQTKLVANIVNGQKFHGHALPYLPRSSVRLDVVTSAGVNPIDARAGDRPALDIDAMGDGLQVLVYQAANATLTYHDWEKFTGFVAHKDLPFSQAEHQARGIPETEFKEVYSRYSKALIAVGAGQGTDMRVGLLTEIVALANPYTDDLSDGLPVQLFYGDDVRADEQIEIFDRDVDGEVTLATLRTDAKGIAHIPVIPGHTYMLDAVILRIPEPALAEEFGAVYESLWANLTFAIPAKD